MEVQVSDLRIMKFNDKTKRLERENSENFQVAFEFNLNATITLIGESETKTRTALPRGKFRAEEFSWS